MGQQRSNEKKIHTYYEVKGEKIGRRLRKCPRCGGFMAFHKENRVRWACGKCSYTEYVEPRK